MVPTVTAAERAAALNAKQPRDHRPPLTAEELSLRGTLGALTVNASRTPAERRDVARKAAQARWAQENERRAAAGEAPTRKTDVVLDDDAMSFYLDRVDERFGLDYVWPNKMARKRQAIAMAREQAARLALEAFGRNK